MRLASFWQRANGEGRVCGADCAAPWAAQRIGLGRGGALSGRGGAQQRRTAGPRQPAQCRKEGSIYAAASLDQHPPESTPDTLHISARCALDTRQTRARHAQDMQARARRATPTRPRGAGQERAPSSRTARPSTRSSPLSKESAKKRPEFHTAHAADMKEEHSACLGTLHFALHSCIYMIINMIK